MLYDVSNGTVSRVRVLPDKLMATCDELGGVGLTIVEVHDSGARRVILTDGKAPTANETAVILPADTIRAMATPEDRAPASTTPVSAPTPERRNSGGWSGGPDVMDETARVRIKAQHAALGAAGVNVDASRQVAATGTRMMDIGYAHQARRAVEHGRKALATDCADALTRAVTDERREDVTCSARELAASIAVNGKMTVLGGLAISEQAIRGLAARLESPMLGYVLGVRDRIVGEVARGDARDRDAIQADRARIAEVLAHECKRRGDTALKLRTRKGPGDVFAIVSPGYVPADAPAVLGQIVDGLHSDARATWSYDPESTSWELRASVWTPTPVEEQAIGEAFEGYVSFQSRDNGTGRFRGGGGVVLIACYNAGTYTADGQEVSRVHRGRILYDIQAMTKGATKAIDALCAAWGRARTDRVEVPSGVKLSDAIPGFWSYLLRDRRSSLAGVLPGRSAEHVKSLTMAYFDQRRDTREVVRSDFAQAWTRMIQAQAPEVRREAESAIGRWIVEPKPIRCDLRGE